MTRAWGKYMPEMAGGCSGSQREGGRCRHISVAIVVCGKSCHIYILLWALFQVKGAPSRPYASATPTRAIILATESLL